MGHYQETGRSIMEMDCPPVIRQAIRRKLASVYAQEASVYGINVDPEAVMVEFETAAQDAIVAHEAIHDANAVGVAALSPAASVAPASAPAPAAPQAMAAKPAASPVLDDGKDPKRVAAGHAAWKTREANANKKTKTRNKRTAARTAPAPAAATADDDRPRGVKAFDTKVRNWMLDHPGITDADARKAVMQHTADGRTRKAKERRGEPIPRTRTPTRTTGRRPAAAQQEQAAARA